MIVVCPEAASTETFKAGASEILSIYGVIRHLIEDIVSPSGRLPNECGSIAALCHVIDGIQCIKRELVPHEDLHAAISDHMRLFIRAYPDAGVKPKNHFALHLPAMLKRHGTLWGCWVHERKHKTLKQFATATTNTRAFEETVSVSLLNHHIETMSVPHAFATGDSILRAKKDDGTLKAQVSPRFPAVEEVMVSKYALTRGAHLAEGDLIWLRDGSVAKCSFFFEVKPSPAGADHFAVVLPFRATAAIRSTVKLQPLGSTDIVELSAIVDTLVWAQDGDEFVALVPAAALWKRMDTHAVSTISIHTNNIR